MLKENYIFPLTFEKVSNYRPFRDHHWVPFAMGFFLCAQMWDFTGHQLAETPRIWILIHSFENLGLLSLQFKIFMFKHCHRFQKQTETCWK